jgi:hypothetical protein
MTPENLDEITEERRKSLAASIRTVNVETLKSLGEELFPVIDHPWRELYFGFLAENPGATFYYGKTLDHVHIVYCPTKDKGIWFIPNAGKGRIQPKALKILRQIVEGK